MSAELREIEEVKGQTRLGRTYTVWAQGATPRGEERRPLKPVYSFETVSDLRLNSARWRSSGPCISTLSDLLICPSFRLSKS